MPESSPPWSAVRLIGRNVATSDGHEARIDDIFFEDRQWWLRWLVIELPGVITSRKRLLPASGLRFAASPAEQLCLTLSLAQLEACPDIDLHQPVSRQMETKIYGSLGWNPYWGGDKAGADQQIGDPTLRSIGELLTYDCRASDGELGQVVDFHIDEQIWRIDHLIIGTLHWWPGKQVVIAVGDVAVIDWSKRSINFRLDRATIKAHPVFAGDNPA